MSLPGLRNIMDAFSFLLMFSLFYTEHIKYSFSSQPMQIYTNSHFDDKLYRAVLWLHVVFTECCVL